MYVRSIYILFCPQVFCFVFYFAPTLGLFHLGTLYKMESTPFARNFIYDVNVTADSELVVPIRVKDVWPEVTDGYDKYTLFNLRSFYAFFIFFIPWQCMILYILKVRVCSGVVSCNPCVWKAS